MQLILAIDGDPRRSEQLAAVVHARLTVELIQATSAGEGLHALRDRVPDLILTSPLLSPFDDGVLDEYLRELGSAATHVQTLRIPMLSTAPRKKSAARRLFSLGRKTTHTSAAAPDGCDPKVFADEIAHYLNRSLEERSASARATAETSASAMPAGGRPTEIEPEPEPAAQPPDVEWGAPEELVQEFTQPAAGDIHVPGSILDLQGPALPSEEPVAAPDPTTVSEPEPLLEVQPESFFEPAPSPPVLVESDPVQIAGAEASTIVTPASPPARTPGTSASFEAALAAIRAAWVKPEPNRASASTVTHPQSSTPSEPADGNRKPPVGSGDVDLTNEIDSLDEGADHTNTSISPPDAARTSDTRRQTERPRKAEKPGGRKRHALDGRDEWGVFDPNQCEFSTLVNKLDEVTESDEVTTRSTTNVR